MGAGCSKKDTPVQSASDSKNKNSKRKSSISRKPTEAFADTSEEKAPSSHAPSAAQSLSQISVEPPKPSINKADMIEPVTKPPSRSPSSPALDPAPQPQSDPRAESHTEAKQEANIAANIEVNGKTESTSQSQSESQRDSNLSAKSDATPQKPPAISIVEKETPNSKEMKGNGGGDHDDNEDGLPVEKDDPNATKIVPFDPLSPAKPPLDIPEHAHVELVKCPTCDRSFAADRIEKHQKVCTGNENSRAVFDVAKKRTEDTSSDIVVYVKHEENEEVTIKLETASIEDLVSKIKTAFPQSSDEVYLYLRLPTRQTPITNNNQLFSGAKIVSSNSVHLHASAFGNKKAGSLLDPVSRPSTVGSLPPLGKAKGAAPLNLEPTPARKAKSSSSGAKKKTTAASESIRQAKAEAARQRKALANAQQDPNTEQASSDKWNVEVMMPSQNQSRPRTANAQEQQLDS
eukprot:TRINITY_DN10024_c0_g1_i1.p1 TRINITY_DN10024_c0_g1~~TRINITY_DN10024_c0_g1_i1.p1  ORF type:complete len:460 (-),score=119.82 TRINITY_DN10024_c0_g1_i1:649-2028(-)